MNEDSQCQCHVILSSLFTCVRISANTSKFDMFMPRHCFENKLRVKVISIYAYLSHLTHCHVWQNDIGWSTWIYHNKCNITKWTLIDTFCDDCAIQRTSVCGDGFHRLADPYDKNILLPIVRSRRSQYVSYSNQLDDLFSTFPIRIILSISKK